MTIRWCTLGDRRHNEAEARALIAKGDQKLLEERLKELKLQKSKAENIEKTTAEKIRFLEQRVEALHGEEGNLAKEKIQAVRFPRERSSIASPLPIIIRYDAIYPLALGTELRENPAIKKNIAGENKDVMHASPIFGRGIKFPAIDKELAETLKTGAGKNLYATLYLYPDSHRAFASLREALAKAGIAYGLEFVRQDRELYFSSEGKAPPQL